MQIRSDRAEGGMKYRWFSSNPAKGFTLGTKAQIWVQTLTKLADFFGTTIDYLVGHTPSSSIETEENMEADPFRPGRRRDEVPLVLQQPRQGLYPGDQGPDLGPCDRGFPKQGGLKDAKNII